MSRNLHFNRRIVEFMRERTSRDANIDYKQSSYQFTGLIRSLGVAEVECPLRRGERAPYVPASSSFVTNAEFTRKNGNRDVEGSFVVVC